MANQVIHDRIIGGRKFVTLCACPGRYVIAPADDGGSIDPLHQAVIDLQPEFPEGSVCERALIAIVGHRVRDAANGVKDEDPQTWKLLNGLAERVNALLADFDHVSKQVEGVARARAI